MFGVAGWLRRAAKFARVVVESLEVVYEYRELREKFDGRLPVSNGVKGFWKYSPILPLKSSANRVSLGEGSSPYHRIHKIGSMLGMKNLFVKDESRNPTCSFKDRKSAVAVSKAVEDGYAKVAAATAGNAGSSVAAYAAKASIESYIFAFQGISKAKIAKLLAYRANVFLTSGSTGDVIEFVRKICDRYQLQNCSAASRHNPYVKEGAKTAVFEIFEQMNGSLPDWIIVPIGGGGNISAYYKGLKELKELGLIQKYPRLVGYRLRVALLWLKPLSKNSIPETYPDPQSEDHCSQYLG